MKSNSIKDWPKSERPRELLLDKGPPKVSNAGLLAVILGCGTAGKDAVALARELLKTFGGLRALFSAGYSDLKRIKGLGDAKISRILSCIELAKRQFEETVLAKECIESPQDVMEYLAFSMRDLKNEFFKILYLDQANSVLFIEDQAVGTVDHAVIYPREVIKKALDLAASAILFVHNHPGGNPNPSTQDLEVTRKLFAACRAVDIKPLDHIIITPNGFHSIINSRLTAVG